MNKSDLADSVSILTSLPVRDSKIVIEAVLDAIKTGLTENSKVALTGFGTFTLVKKSERMARNPKTGEAIKVPAKTVVKFKPATELKNLS